jgi:hypothetical protein
MQITDPASGNSRRGAWRRLLHPPLALQARVRPDALNGFLKRLASGRARSRRPRRDRQRDLALSSSCRGKSGAVLRGCCPTPLAGVVWAATGEVSLSVVKDWSRRERGETRLGATRLAPEAARTCEGCAARPEQSVGDNRVTQLIGAQRRVALNRRPHQAPGWQAVARYPTRKEYPACME